jgi:adenosine deaminase
VKPRAESAAEIHPELHSRLRPFAVASLIAFLLILAPMLPVGGLSVEDCAASREKQVALQFDAFRQNPEELRAFFLAMPKGGDIHNHLTGAVYAENLIDQASAEGLCISLNNDSVSHKYCGSDNSEPARDTYSNPNLYGQIIDAWSMRDSNLLDKSGHDHFFDSFGFFGGATGNTSALVADIRSNAFLENVAYLEVMTGASSGAANLGSKVGWGGMTTYPGSTTNSSTTALFPRLRA